MRTHYCGQLNKIHIDKTVTLCGWVHRRRDHGGIIFIDLRDREGLIQIICDPNIKDVFQVAENVRNEFVLKVTGLVRLRPKGTMNLILTTGEIEILGKKLEILSKSKIPPIPMDNINVNEELRLRYRYLDLRRANMQKHIFFRSQVTRKIRHYLDRNGFLDIETPILTKSTPEGARDYLVKSRNHQGQFFALPQSPQLFKQLLMIAGIDRYYQIARCFRDEDLRADRQPEFTQLDIEMSFIEEEDIMGLMEKLICKLFNDMLGITFSNPFPRLTYIEAIRRFGSDHPDLRCPLELVDVADLMLHVDFKVFAEPAKDPHSRVVALRVPNGGELSRKEIDNYTKFVEIYGAKGLAYIKVNDTTQGRHGLQSPILKFFPDKVINGILGYTCANDGDLVFFSAGKSHIVNEAMGALRIKLGKDRGLMNKKWAPLWIVNFPMFRFNEKENCWMTLHHPFTAPKDEYIDHFKEQPEKVLSRAYDMIINGSEIGGGSIRIHRADIQQQVFELLGMKEKEGQKKFRFLLDALKYGCPPHGGIAFGLDRLIMIMNKANSIRDVIAFPKTQTAACLLTDAPSFIST